MKTHIPNIFTLLNLFCGCIAVVYASSSNYIGAAIFVCIGIFFDFFDGFIARQLDVQSELGLQLDSLADMVTSGLVPGVAMFKMLKIMSYRWGTFDLTDDVTIPIVPLFGFSITLASCYRLAKFNIDDDQKENFIGLPTPANALFILSFPLILSEQNIPWINVLFHRDWFLIAVTILSCYLLNANIKLFSLKFKSWDLSSNIEKYLLLLVSLILIITLKYLAVPIIIMIYIVLSLIKNTISKT